MAVPFWDALYAFIQFGMVLSVWSYLYKENVFSRLSATIIVAISSVHYCMWMFKMSYNDVIVPLFTGLHYGETVTLGGRLLCLAPLILGLFIYLRISRKYSWLSTYSYAIMLGLGTGAVLTTIVERSIVGLIVTAIMAPLGKATAFETFSGILILIGTLLSITYWIFTREATGVLGYGIKVGRLFLMASIGMLYAEDVLWSQSLFVSSMEMVIKNFIKAVLLGIPI